MAGLAGGAGTDGADGTAGTDGSAGSDGANGTNGTNGTNGADGQPGMDAVAGAVVIAGATAASIGDSNTARNGPWGHEGQRYTPQTAWFHLASTRLGQRVRLTDNFAVSGARSDEMLEQQVPKVLELTRRPSVVTVMAGTNDVDQGRSAEQIIASLDASYSALTQNGIRVVAGTILPSAQWSVPAKSAVVVEVNEWIRARAEVTVVDFNAVLADDLGAPLPGVLMDGTHVSTVGAALMGRELASTLETMFPRIDVFPVRGDALATSVVAKKDGVIARASEGFVAGDSVVAMVEFTTAPGADGSVSQIEATLSAVGTSGTSGVLTDTPGYDGPDVPLVAVPRSGVLMTLPLRVSENVTSLSLSVTATDSGGGVFRVGRVALVKVD